LILFYIGFLKTEDLSVLVIGNFQLERYQLKT